MTATLSHSSPVRFELANADTWRNPWPMYSALRDHDPVHHVIPQEKPDHDYWVMSRHADIWTAARDHETFSSAQGLTVNYGELEMIGLQDNPPFVMQDPPVHTEFRKLVSRGLHSAAGRGGRAQGPRIRRRAHRAAARRRRRRHRRRAVQAAAVDGRRALSRGPGGGPPRSSTAGPRRSSRPTPLDGGVAGALGGLGEARRRR